MVESATGPGEYDFTLKEQRRVPARSFGDTFVASRQGESEGAETRPI